jgi:mannose-1-phosphate guanylyltransferase
MQAVVLVGGEGTRLRPLTLQTPKPMVPLFNVPFLERTLIRLREAGITNAILPAGYLPAAITDYFGDGSRIGMQLTYVIEKEPLGTAGAIKNVEEHITGPFFVLNGDILTSLDLKEMLACHKRFGGAGLLHLITVDNPSAFGCVVTNDKHQVTAFVEKPAPGTEPTNAINAGTYLLEREVLDLIPAGRAVSIERETFPLIVAGKNPLYAFTTQDYWMDLGKPEQYLSSHRHVLDGKMPIDLSDSASHAQVLMPSYIGRDVKLAADAVVGPYAILGDGCEVAAGATVRDTILWKGVNVGAGAQIDGAIVADNARIGARATIAPGAVIGHDAVVAEDAVLDGDARVSAVKS